MEVLEQNNIIEIVKNKNLEHIAIIKGDVKSGDPVLVRVHSSCATGDIFGSMRCDCGEQLQTALKMIEKEGGGLGKRNCGRQAGNTRSITG